MNRALHTHFTTITIQNKDMYGLGNATILSTIAFIGQNIIIK